MKGFFSTIIFVLLLSSPAYGVTLSYNFDVSDAVFNFDVDHQNETFGDNDFVNLHVDTEAATIQFELVNGDVTFNYLVFDVRDYLIEEQTGSCSFDPLYSDGCDYSNLPLDFRILEEDPTAIEEDAWNRDSRFASTAFETGSGVAANFSSDGPFTGNFSQFTGSAPFGVFEDESFFFTPDGLNLSVTGLGAITTVANPEPSTIMLMGLFMLLLFGARIKKAE